MKVHFLLFAFFSMLVAQSPIVDDLIGGSKRLPGELDSTQSQSLDEVVKETPLAVDANQAPASDEIAGELESPEEASVTKEESVPIGVLEFDKECSFCNDEVIPEIECVSEFCFDIDPWCDPEKRWYFEIEPGYYYFTDSDMRKFFNDGGFTVRAETGYRFYGPFTVWIDGGYFQKSGSAIGGNEDLEIKLATLTLGLKLTYFFNSCVAIYGGAGPRLFMMMMDNDSPFVRGDDNEIGIGGGFDAGLWVFPIPQWPNFFFDAFVDYSWKKMKVEPDEISSMDNDVDVSGISAGLGIGIRF